MEIIYVHNNNTISIATINESCDSCTTREAELYERSLSNTIGALSIIAAQVTTSDEPLSFSQDSEVVTLPKF